MMSTGAIDPSQLPDEPVGYFYAWWRGDPLPEVERPPELEMQPSADDEELARASGLALAVVETRRQKGHRPYVARAGDEIVGFGWMASREFDIGELGVTRQLPADNRYLWDFVTVPAWRGKGIYPALLQTMILDDADATRFWVGHDRPNIASGRGITRAGFQTVGEVYAVEDAGVVYVPTGPEDRAGEAAALLGLPLVRREG